MESSASSGSSKRAKAPPPSNNITQVVSCLVDGCNSDLSECREYHRRHKVCELHSKAPKVTIGGWEQRFCQQCSRFHSLVEFDEGKRSCRKRLDGHNRRRRKPHSDSLSRTTGSFLTDQQGSILLSFGNPQIFPSAIVSPSWAGAVKSENETVLYSTNALFDRSIPVVSARQPFLDPNSALGNSFSSKKMFYDGLNRAVDSDRAFSLLSSEPAETREIGFLSNMVRPEPVPQDQSLNCVFGSQGRPENKPEFLDGSYASESHYQTLSFMWE